MRAVRAPAADDKATPNRIKVCGSRNHAAISAIITPAASAPASAAVSIEPGGNGAPAAIKTAAARAEVADTPSTPGSANGLRSSPCITAPDRPRAAPTSAAATPRGARIDQRTCPGAEEGSRAARRYCADESGDSPTASENAKAATRIPVKTRIRRTPSATPRRLGQPRHRVAGEPSRARQHGGRKRHHRPTRDKPSKQAMAAFRPALRGKVGVEKAGDHRGWRMQHQRLQRNRAETPACLEIGIAGGAQNGVHQGPSAGGFTRRGDVEGARAGGGVGGGGQLAIHAGDQALANGRPAESGGNASNVRAHLRKGSGVLKGDHRNSASAKGGQERRTATPPTDHDRGSSR